MDRLFISAALAIALAVPTAYAQTQPPPRQPPTTNQSPSGAPGAGVSQQTGEYMAEDIIGASVRNQQNDNIGSVTDLLIDHNGQVRAAIVSVGGFLGIGDKHVAVPWNQMQVRAQNGAARGTSETGSGSAAAARNLVLMVNMTKEQLQQAPAFRTVSDQTRRGGGTGPSGSGTYTTPPAGTTSPSR
jgi:hypothetical protein